ncbi:MAG TPA: sulfatase-like hydrolase/transferase [Chthoniobacteraceae bacterium]|jgi:hypothetical protein|nr:sulfatase-like hydrolase/transferase [Chthoniobacteraceae bacterium]
MNVRTARVRSLLILLAVLAVGSASLAAERPNIVLIYADDLGCGDLSCYGATPIQTPHIGRLAQEGLRFTDAHSPSATCTPSRCAMMTGEYAWRKKGTGVLPGEAPLIIEPARTTMTSVLKTSGYQTGVIGKWHLGLGTGNLDWNGDIQLYDLATDLGQTKNVADAHPEIVERMRAALEAERAKAAGALPPRFGQERNNRP